MKAAVHGNRRLFLYRPMHRHRVRVTNGRSGALVAVADVADSAATRRTGLLGRDRLPPGEGLLIRPCPSIHTWFMRFSIDAVFLDRSGTVVRIARDLAPFRLAWGVLRARDTLEIPAGQAAATDLRPGDRLEITDAVEP